MRRARSPKTNPNYPLAYILGAVRDDARAQDDIDKLLCDAANLIFDLAQRSEAFDEPFPRGYRVRQIRARPNHPSGPKLTRLELRQLIKAGFWGGGSNHKIAERDENGTRLKTTSHFMAHLNDGLLHEIGAYFVERSRQTKEIHQTLEESLENVRTLRHLLLTDPSLLPEDEEK